MVLPSLFLTCTILSKSALSKSNPGILLISRYTLRQFQENPMAENADHRKLAAILCADVKGYSKLMGEDESYTVGALKECRKLFAENIQNHGGRVVNAPGDSILAEFPSVVSAVQCAVEIQNQLDDRNTELPENRKMVFRIGVNLGDVIQSEDAIYGDGVNIAARIEALAEPGGVSISRTVFNHVRNKLPYGYEYQGEHQVKNIANPVKVYKLLTTPEDTGKLVGMEPTVSASKWIWPTVVVAAIVVTLIGYQVYQEIAGPRFEPASVEKMAYPLPEKPSIAVLPFKNLSGDPKQNYLSEGLTEQIISTLSRFRTLFVISGNSTSTYKGKNVKIQNVAEDLGVRYVLEGSLQTSADRIRITAQLIDATTGHYIWSQRYDREQKEIFAIQDDITLEITKALQADVMSGEQARIWAKNSTTNLEAWEKWLQGDEYFFRITKDDNATARRLFEEAIVLDPEYAFAYVMLGWTYWMDARFGWVDSRAESFKVAGKYAQKGMELNDSLDNAYYLMGSVYFNQGQHEKGIAEVERAIALNPNGANNYNGLAMMVGGLGRWDESIQLAKKAIRLHPFAKASFYHTLGRAYFMTGQYDEAIATLKKSLEKNPNYLPAHAFLAACYSSLDRLAEAASEADEVRRINPKFNLESYAKTLPYKNKADKELYIAALRKAGLK
jgi:adenylate cyclase